MLSFLACCFISALPMLQKVVGVSSCAAGLSEFLAFPPAAIMVVDVGNFLQNIGTQGVQELFFYLKGYENGSI